MVQNLSELFESGKNSKPNQIKKQKKTKKGIRNRYAYLIRKMEVESKRALAHVLNKGRAKASTGAQGTKPRKAKKAALNP